MSDICALLFSPFQPYVCLSVITVFVWARTNVSAILDGRVWIAPALTVRLPVYSAKGTVMDPMCVLVSPDGRDRIVLKVCLINV